MGCDGIKTDTFNQASQMDVQMSDNEVNCQLLVPDEKDEEAIEQEVVCFKCNGSQVNKKNMPCRKCAGTGMIMSNELGELQDIVKQEVGDFCREHFKQMFRDYLEAKQLEQENQVHKGIQCDGCNVVPIRGIRYKSAVLSDYDLCQECERNGVHKDKPLLKIRKPHMAPVKLICQMRNMAANPQPQPQP